MLVDSTTVLQRSLYNSELLSHPQIRTGGSDRLPWPGHTACTCLVPGGLKGTGLAGLAGTFQASLPLVPPGFHPSRPVPLPPKSHLFAWHLHLHCPDSCHHSRPEPPPACSSRPPMAVLFEVLPVTLQSSCTTTAPAPPRGGRRRTGSPSPPSTPPAPGTRPRRPSLLARGPAARGGRAALREPPGGNEMPSNVLDRKPPGAETARVPSSAAAGNRVPPRAPHPPRAAALSGTQPPSPATPIPEAQAPAPPLTGQ